MKHDEFHRKFADAVIKQIRKGTAPWQKPWAPGERVRPMNVDTHRSYRGGNSLHLAAVQQEKGYSDVRWGTYRQIQARGGQVRKGERGTRILSFRDRKRIAVADERGRPVRNGQGKHIHRYEKLKAPFVRQYTVFNAEQADGLPARATPAPEPLWKTHQAAERVLEDSGVPIRHVQGDRAGYHMKRDEIVLPKRAQFPSANRYYQTALHELGHSTGHPERMKRETLIEGIRKGFGSPDYAREELRAEISAMMTGERIGVATIRAGAQPTSRAGSRPLKRTPARSGAPPQTHRRSPTSCSPGTASALPPATPPPCPQSAHPRPDPRGSSFRRPGSQPPAAASGRAADP